LKHHWPKLPDIITEPNAAKLANMIGVPNPIITGWPNPITIAH
jgi:hypothetical protein